jgi:DNA-binding transcriptional LysR family regulator
MTASETFGSHFLAPRLSGFRGRYPNISLVLLASDQPLDLSRREADIAIRMFKPKQPNLIVRRVGESAFALYAAPEYISARGAFKSAATLAGHNVVGFDDTLADSPAGKWLALAETGACVVSRCNSFAAAAEMANAGLGIAVLPCYLGEAIPGLQRASAGEVARHEIWLAIHSDVQRNSRVRALSEFVSELLQREAPRLLGRSVADALKPAKLERK